MDNKLIVTTIRMPDELRDAVRMLSAISDTSVNMIYVWAITEFIGRTRESNKEFAAVMKAKEDGE